MAKGKQLNERLKNLILVEYATNRNYSETGRTFGIAESTVRKIVKGNKDQLKLCEEKVNSELLGEAIDFKKQFLKNAEESIQKAVNLSTQRIELASVSHEQFSERIDKLIELLSTNRNADAKTIADVVKSLSSVMNVPLKDLSVFIGTMYDKRALSLNQATAITKNENDNNNTNTETSVLDLSNLSDNELELLEHLYDKPASS